MQMLNYFEIEHSACPALLEYLGEANAAQEERVFRGLQGERF